MKLWHGGLEALMPSAQLEDGARNRIIRPSSIWNWTITTEWIMGMPMGIGSVAWSAFVRALASV